MSDMLETLFAWEYQGFFDCDDQEVPLRDGMIGAHYRRADLPPLTDYERGVLEAARSVRDLVQKARGVAPELTTQDELQLGLAVVKAALRPDDYKEAEG